jgi:hypothetical protein
MAMYPGTTFEIIPKSTSTLTSERTVIPPAFICCFSSEKGPEGMKITEGEEFFKLYGTDISFAKHGQPLLQAANIINNGGIVIGNRVVAKDSTLANLTLWGVVKTANVQKKNNTGALLYYNAVTGEETTATTTTTESSVVNGETIPGTTVANAPVMIKSTTVSYETRSYSNVVSIAQVKAMTEQAAPAEAVKTILPNEAGSTVSTAPIKLCTTATDFAPFTQDFGNLSAFANKNVSAMLYLNNVYTLYASTDAPIPYATVEKGYSGDSASGNFVATRITLPTNKSTVGMTISVTGVNSGPWGPEVLTDNMYLDHIMNIKNLTSYTITFNWADGTSNVYTIDCSHVAKQNADGSVTASTPVAYEGTTDAYVQKFPLYAITDNGRGASKKKIRIYPDNRASKVLSYMLYNIQVIENSDAIEELQFCSDYELIAKGENMSLQTIVSKYSSQIKAYIFTNYQDMFIDAIATSVGVTGDDLKSLDYFFGTSKNGKYTIDYLLTKAGIKAANTALTYDFSTGTNISTAFGLDLTNGSNGSFGTAPWGTASYFEEVLDFWTDANGTGEIYDRDNIKPSAILDCNYPFNIKQAIERVVKFREDCFYFRDLGLGLKDKDSIYYAELDNDSIDIDGTVGIEEKDTMFCGTYHVSYDVIDPYTKRQIPVTICYTLSKLLPKHFINGADRPVCGQLYGMVLNDAVEGTVNFIPRVKPGVNDKEDLDDNRINYAGLEDGLLVLESDWTAITSETEFCYIHNVLAVQEVMRAIRRRCPKIRYSFLTQEDLQNYKKDVQEVLDKFAGKFKVLQFEYIEDKKMVQKKVFYAAIKVMFKDFIRHEYFKIYEIENDGSIF